MTLPHILNHHFTNASFTEFCIHGTDYHFAYAIYRMNQILNVKLLITFGVSY